jgi:ABC-type dipeptide/oligopeptide/nickel transport system ATPase subunit
MARITRHKVAFARLKSPRLERVELDYTKEQNREKGLVFGACDGLKGALVKVAVRYREEDAAFVEEQVAGLLKQVRPVARHIFPVEKEVVRKSRARDPGMTLQVPPLESFHRWLDGRGVVEQAQRDSLEAVFLTHVEKVGVWPEPLQAARFMVTNIEVQDYIPFNGPSVAGGLEEGVYGIVGAYQGNAKRSNRAGKSALLKAVLTSLFGDEKGDAVRDIHHGRDGYRIGVDLAFDDPSLPNPLEVVRFRKRLGEVACGLDGAKCSVTSLNEQLSRWLRFTKEDFTKIAFVKAGDLHGIVGSGNAQMKQDLMRWLGLEGWSLVHDSLRREVLQLEADLAHRRAVVRGWGDERSVIEDELKNLGELGAVEAAVQRARGAVMAATQKLAERQAGLEAGRLKRERTELVEKLKREIAHVEWNGGETVPPAQLAEKLSSALPALRRERDGLKAKVTAMKVTAGQLVEQKERFRSDHLCPLAKVECPIAEKVCFSVDADDREAKSLADERSALRVVLAGCEDRLEKMEKLDREMANRVARAKVFRSRIEEIDGRLRGQKEEEIDDALEELEDARTEASVAERELIQWRHLDERVNGLSVKVDEAIAQNSVTSQRCAMLRVAMMACGRDGIPTLQMENALSAVEAGANAVLQLADAPHRVSFSFQRELKKLEDECQGCGRAFDGSEKACKHCGEERRNKKSEDISLEVIDANGRTQDFSQDSSGGKALAALALRVALAQHFGFSVLFLDEVCASLDDENLDLMVRLLNRLRSMGFDQVFVISHRQRVRDLLDRLIVVERDDALGRSKFFLQG